MSLAEASSPLAHEYGARFQIGASTERPEKTEDFHADFTSHEANCCRERTPLAKNLLYFILDNDCFVASRAHRQTSRFLSFFAAVGLGSWIEAAIQECNTEAATISKQTSLGHAATPLMNLSRHDAQSTEYLLLGLMRTSCRPALMSPCPFGAVEEQFDVAAQMID
jgi:hypothetical protein